MILKTFYLNCLAHASYLIGDEKSKLAVVVDPQRDVDAYVAEAKKRGLKIAHVVLTHFHADFVSGHLELRRRTGATIHLGAKAKPNYPCSRLKDGAFINLGTVRLQVLETPGHTPEAISLLAYDLNKSDAKPQAVFTGDTLFIGDVGRPDLMASVGVTAKALGSQLYDSLRKKLMTLPDETLVYPAHGAGSLCGKNLSSDTVSTIGRERRYNYALQPMTRAKFIKLVAADQPPAPAYFAYDAGLNKRRHPTLEEALKKVKPLALARLLKLQKSGAQILDTRDPADFAKGHLPGSLNVGLGGKFATFAGVVLDPAKPVALVCPTGKEKESALRLGRIGLDAKLVGYLQGGLASVPEARLARFPRLQPADLRRHLDSLFPPAVLDVRTPAERENGSIPNSVHIPLLELPKRLKEVPKAAELVVTCAGGYRSAIAASVLLKAGVHGVSDLDGGMAAWGMKAACAAK